MSAVRTVAGGALLGAAATAAAHAALRPVLRRPALERTNAGGRALPTAGGLPALVALPALAVVTGSPPARPAALAAAGFGLLGLADDVWGDRSGVGGTRGLRGHARALLRGRPTTGAAKLVGGPLVGLVAAAALDGPRARLDPVGTLAAGATIALGANVANLFDRAPGRCLKVLGLVGVPGLLVVAPRAPLAGAAGAAVLGSGAALARADLGERLMLGDTGAGLLGAALAASLVGPASRRVRLAAAASLLGLTVASERWSFSAVIRSNGLLRGLDDLGRQGSAGQGPGSG